MKWWGWGDPGKRLQLGAGAAAMLRERVGAAEPAGRVELEAVRMPPPRALPQAIAALPGATFDSSHASRVSHAGGKSYPDLFRARSGELAAAPDAVVSPQDAGAVAGLLEACARAGVAVVPFGGGTSVVGGVEPIAAGHTAVIALDLRALRHVEVDRVAMTARLGPGLLGPEVERALGAAGLTLGHFPQSFEYASIGGFAATRSAGQASAGYGRFDALVAAAELVTPRGPLRTLATPHTAAGPSLRELIVGSEGTLGVITDVTARVRPAPAERRYEGWMAADFEAGSQAVRSLAQAGALPDVARLSDEEETRVSLALSSTAPWKRSLLEGYLRLRRRAGGCMLIVGWEGEAEDLERRRAISSRLLRRAGAVRLGAAPGRAWSHGRFEGPYLRDELMDLGYFVETLETSHTWSRYQGLYRAVGGAIEGALADQGTPGLCWCHLSHAYRDGASLYFTFIAPRRVGAEIEQWRAVKTAACEAITATGGTITHHHAVGRDHAAYMGAEIGALGIDALRALKDELDPAGIMNPGKLLPPVGSEPSSHAR